MTERQWTDLLKLVNEGGISRSAGFIIDSPWLPGWAGMSKIDYYSSGEHWFEANRRAVETFPDIIFLPGFWSEFGMFTEPSAFGAKVTWHEDSLPWAGKVLHDITDAGLLEDPDPERDGMLPFVVARLQHYHDKIRTLGHEIRFAVARGPLNIASYLRGTTELMTDLMMQPDAVEQLLEKITSFLERWLILQKERFPSIGGILLLDDLIGFIGEEAFRRFVLPHFRRLFHAFDAPVRFLHNDAQGLITARYLTEMGVNLFNFSFEHSLDEIRELAGPGVVLLGNLPPRDVLAAGTADEVKKATKEMVTSTRHPERILWSCGGGMPPDVPTGNIQAFLEGMEEGLNTIP